LVWHQSSELSTGTVVVSGLKVLWATARRFILAWTVFGAFRLTKTDTMTFWCFAGAVDTPGSRGGFE
jgi:hypothetical protein